MGSNESESESKTRSRGCGWFVSCLTERKMKTELQIEGMSCEACVSFVVGALQNVEGVERALVDLSTARAEVEGEDYDVADLIESVEEEGYGARVTAFGRPPFMPRLVDPGARSSAMTRAPEEGRAGRHGCSTRRKLQKVWLTRIPYWRGCPGRRRRLLLSDPM